jgi:hypothetical protein
MFDIFAVTHCAIFANIVFAEVYNNKGNGGNACPDGPSPRLKVPNKLPDICYTGYQYH